MGRKGKAVELLLGSSVQTLTKAVFECCLAEPMDTTGTLQGNHSLLPGPSDAGDYSPAAQK